QTALPFLERWNRKRMKPSYLWRQLKEHAPDWVEQFPHFPQLVLDNLQQQRAMLQINETLQTVLIQQRLHDKRRRRRLRRLMVVLAVVVLVSGFLYFNP